MATYSTGFCVATTWKPVGGAHLADVRQLQEALVERRQQHVLHALGHAVELVDEQHAAVAHGLDQRPGEERLLAVALLEHERRVEPAGELALGVAVVAVDAHGVAAEVAADGQGDGGLAHADRALEQQVTAGAEHGEGRGQFALAADDAVLALDLLDGGHVVTFQSPCAYVHEDERVAMIRLALGRHHFQRPAGVGAGGEHVDAAAGEARAQPSRLPQVSGVPHASSRSHERPPAMANTLWWPARKSSRSRRSAVASTQARLSHSRVGRRRSAAAGRSRTRRAAGGSVGRRRVRRAGEAAAGACSRRGTSCAPTRR